MTKVYKVYTREKDGDWKMRRMSFDKPRMDSWNNPTQDVRIVSIDLPNYENVVEERHREDKKLIRVCYCENCQKAVKHGVNLYIYTDYYQDYDDGHIQENDHYFCSKDCAVEFAKQKIYECTPQSNHNYNHAFWDWIDEETILEEL